MKPLHQTVNCIRCTKPAKFWTGHVKQRDGRPVIAGWCSRRCCAEWVPYHGLYQTKMGKESLARSLQPS